jgi:hypothetical protein
MCPRRDAEFEVEATISVPVRDKALGGVSIVDRTEHTRWYIYEDRPL